MRNGYDDEVGTSRVRSELIRRVQLIEPFVWLGAPGVNTYNAHTNGFAEARYDKMMEAFGGVGYQVESPDELKRAVNEALAAGKPALVNAIIDETAGTESGRIGNLNPQSVVAKK